MDQTCDENPRLGLPASLSVYRRVRRGGRERRSYLRGTRHDGFQRLGQIPGNVSTEHGPALAAIAHRLQAAEGMGNTRPGC